LNGISSKLLPIRNKNISWRVEKKVEETVAKILKHEDIKNPKTKLSTVILVVGNESYGLNFTTGKIWQMIDGKNSIENIVKKFIDIFDSNEHILSKETALIINYFLKNKWIEYNKTEVDKT
jgi:hypothetical protein